MQSVKTAADLPMMTVSADGLAAAAALREMLDRRLGGVTMSSEYFDRSFDVLWADLVDGEWDLIGTSTVGLPIRDLAAVAAVWGTSLCPLPFVFTVLARRWTDDSDTLKGRMITFDVHAGRGGRGRIPFGDRAATVELGPARRAQLQTSRLAVDEHETDSFAPSLPITLVTRRRPLSANFLPELRLLLAAGAVGVATTALSLTIDFARVREAFGQPIASFQAVKHLIADMCMRCEMASTAVAWCALEPAASDGCVDLAVESARQVVESAIQLHGGIGFAWENSLNFYLRHIIATGSLLRKTKGGVHA